MSGNGDFGGQNYYGYDNAAEDGLRRQPSAPPAGRLSCVRVFPADVPVLRIYAKKAVSCAVQQN